jgi:hypothetical protein
MDPKPPLSERFKFQFDGVLELSWKWNRPQVMPLLLFLCLCPGPCGLCGEGLVSGTMRIKEHGKVIGSAHIPWLGYILISAAILMVAVLLGPRDLPKDFTGGYAVYVIDQQGKRRLLVSGLDTKEQGAWLARELRRALRMRQPEEEGT